MFDVVDGCLVTAGGAGMSSRKDRSSGRCAVYTSCVCICEVNTLERESIDVGGDCFWCGVEAAYPVVHVIHCDEEDVRLIGSRTKSEEEGADSGEVEERFIHRAV